MNFCDRPRSGASQMFVPYLFVVLNKGYTVDDIRGKGKGKS